MFAYVDETGNTGSNVFDPNQPYFFTAALVVKTNFDIVYANDLRKICAEQNAGMLHASVLGFGPIEAMSPAILKLLKKANARIVVSRVEKQYLIATKLFDTFFDSGVNPSVPWTVYNLRPLRLILAFKVASLLDEDLAFLFWQMLMEKTEDRAREIIPEICDIFLSRVEALPDARSREIIGEAFAWSRAHPEALDIHTPGRHAKKGHMPNLVAFTNLLNGIDRISKRWRRPVHKILHDWQSQFEQTLAEYHLLTTNASSQSIKLPGETEVLRMVPGSVLDFSASNGSAGIQIADLFLWLLRRFLTGKSLPTAANRLLSFSMKRAVQTDFSFKGVSEAMLQTYSEILESKLPPEKIAATEQILARLEEHRLRAMAGYEEDGLMPFQRDEPLFGNK